MCAQDASRGPLSLEALASVVQCPETGQRLVVRDGEFQTKDGLHRYTRRDGILDLQRPPPRFKMDVPWYEPWADLDRMRADPPAPLDDPDLPYHLDPYQFAVIGHEGRGRWVLEVGCGERQCEKFLTDRGFVYVGIDVDHRGMGPNLFADAHNLPFRDDAFDIAFSMAVYQHLANPLQAAQEAFRVIKPGGLYLATAAFVYGWTDRASFFHMSHAALLVMLTYAGFENIRVWPDWHYSASIPNMSFTGTLAGPWRHTAEWALGFLDWSYTRAADVTRTFAGRPGLSTTQRDLKTAGSLTFVARKPGPST